MLVSPFGPATGLGALLQRVVGWRMDALRLEGQADPTAREWSRDVLSHFYAGAGGSFARSSPSELARYESGLPSLRRYFFWEGQAFGASAQHAFRFAPGNPQARYHAPGFRFMFFTGVGFWNGMAARYALPFVRMTREAWVDAPDFAAFRQIIAGGLAFPLVLMKGRLDGSSLRRFARANDRAWARGLIQGTGRAAWFLHMRDPPALRRHLAEAGDLSAALAEGIGIAMTFTQAVEPTEILAQLDAFPPAFQPALRTGVRLALGVARVDDSRIDEQIAAMPSPLPRFADEGRSALEAAGRGEEMPERLASSLAQME
jgi:Protein of unknown function (DUF1702)